MESTGKPIVLLCNCNPADSSPQQECEYAAAGIAGLDVPTHLVIWMEK